MTLAWIYLAGVVAALTLQRPDHGSVRDLAASLAFMVVVAAAWPLVLALFVFSWLRESVAWRWVSHSHPTTLHVKGPGGKLQGEVLWSFNRRKRAIMFVRVERVPSWPSPT